MTLVVAQMLPFLIDVKNDAKLYLFFVSFGNKIILWIFILLISGTPLKTGKKNFLKNVCENIELKNYSGKYRHLDIHPNLFFVRTHQGHYGNL